MAHHTTLGKALRAARRSLGLSQRALAARAGIGQNMVVRAENGADVRLSTLLRLAHAAELEPRLVPRNLAAGIDGIVASYRAGKDLDTAADRPMYEIDPDI